MRETILKKLAYWHASYPWRMLLVVLILTLSFGSLATQLKHTMRWSDLLPTKNKRTIEFNRILDEFIAASGIIVVVQGEEKRIKQFADALAPRLLEARETSKNAELQKKIDKLEEKINKLMRKGGKEKETAKFQSLIDTYRAQMNKKLIQRVDYKAEVDFIQNNGLMLIKKDDLKNIKDVFKDPNLSGLVRNINNSMEQEYVGQDESISTREKEDQAVVFLDGIQNLVRLMQKYVLIQEVSEREARDAVDKLLLGEPYFLSYDKTALIMNAIPTFTIMDADLLVKGTDTIQAVVDDLLKDFPEIEAGLTGIIPLGRDEMVYSLQSLGYTSLIAFVAILLLLIISFRMWVAPVFAMFNLLVGVLWAMGVAAVVVKQLNIFTSMFAVVLIGLGIDFSIHIISSFTEWRASGKSIAESMEQTFLKSGKGILTGGLTTACAFLTMVISSSRGMKEMGLVTGTGLLAILLTSFLLLPMLLVFRERRLKRRRQRGKEPSVKRDISFRFLGNVGNWLSRHYIFTIFASIVFTVLLVLAAFNITFDHNYMNIEPEGLTSILLQDTVLDKFDLTMDYASVLANSVDESREISKKYREMSSVAMTEDISLYLPSVDEQQERIPYISEVVEAINKATIRSEINADELSSLKEEIERLQMNIMEIQDMAYLGGRDKVDTKCKEIVGDPEQLEPKNMIQEFQKSLNTDNPSATKRLSALQKVFAPYFKESSLKMCSVDPIHLENLPPSILDRYSNKSRTNFLVTIFPAGNIWQDAGVLKRFVDDLDKVIDRATGMPPVFRTLIEIIGRDGRNAALLTIFIVFFLLWLDFHRPQYALMAMIPLAIGVFWMVGFMHLTGMQFTVMNVMGLPMILGIGIDDGVHIVHRWRIEGKGKSRIVFSSTGKAILLTSLTTMLAFGSLVFSIWRGFGQLGGALFLGVGACFLTTVIVLSGIIGLTERK